MNPTTRWITAAAAELDAKPSLLVASADLDDILGDDYHRDTAVESAHTCFTDARRWVSENALSHLPMLIIQLDDSTELDIDVPHIGKLQEDLHEFTPPGLYLCRRVPGLGLPSGEEYTVQLSQDAHTSMHGTVLCYYTCARSLELREMGGEYTRSIRFLYDRLAGSDSIDLLIW